MYLNHDEILELCRAGYMENWDESCINAASMDVRLGNEILCENDSNRILDYSKRDKPSMSPVTLNYGGFALRPGEFILAHTIEKCNFPDDIAALFRIKSSMGRIGLEHMDAGWVDPGFHGSLTLEFKMMLNHHWIQLRPGDRIGQLIFFRGNKVSSDKSYRTVGNYNGAISVKQIGFDNESKGETK
jgi:dCTP deaminase